MEGIPAGQIQQDFGASQAATAQDPSTGVTAWALGLAKVISINEEAFLVELRSVTGSTSDSVYAPVPLGMPGAGKRHILGAMPEVGDLAVVGWMPYDSKSYRKMPVVLNWFPPNPWLAQQWMTGQSFSPEEADMSPKLRAQMEGYFGRTRYKIPAMKPGNIAGSSSQGSDFLLNESVILSNRRANELILRDQDQALVTRSVQQFLHMAGATIFGGLVQRDANLLPRQMFSDGRLWHPVAVEDVSPESDKTTTDTTGYLTPAAALYHGEGETTPDSGLVYPTHLDPYEFLQRGLFIDSEGFLLDPERTFSDAVYGGKPIFRVATRPGENAASSDAPSFTEHRLEVAHTSDGTLPVAVQTDGLDADKLRGQQTYLEVVHGTVVGNDAFSVEGRTLYGVPLRPTLDPEPQLESAIGHPLGEQAALLVKLQPPAEVLPDAKPTWWALQKDGRLKFSIAGPGDSISGSAAGSVSLDAGSEVHLQADSGVKITAPTGAEGTNHAFEVLSERGAVSIYAGGSSTAGVAGARNSGEGEFSSPSVRIEGRGNTHLIAGGSLILTGTEIVIDASSVTYTSLGSMAMQAGDAYNHSSKQSNVTTSGQANYVHGGPSDGKDSNGPARTTNFTVLPVTGGSGGVVDDYKVAYGGRYEEFTKGDHETKMVVGNMQYTTGQGSWTATAGANTLKMDSQTGMSANVPTGNMNLETSGTAAFSGDASVVVRSASGGATMTAQGGVVLGGPGLPVGYWGIINGSDLDPLTGAPLVSFGMGSPSHQLTGHL